MQRLVSSTLATFFGEFKVSVEVHGNKKTEGGRMQIKNHLGGVQKEEERNNISGS